MQIGAYYVHPAMFALRPHMEDAAWNDMVVPNRAIVKDRTFQHDHDPCLSTGLRRSHSALYTSPVARNEL